MGFGSLFKGRREPKEGVLYDHATRTDKQNQNEKEEERDVVEETIKETKAMMDKEAAGDRDEAPAKKKKKKKDKDKDKDKKKEGDAKRPAESDLEAANQGEEDEANGNKKQKVGEETAVKDVDKESKEWTGKEIAAHARAAMKQNTTFTFGFEVQGAGQGAEGGGQEEEDGGAAAAAQDSRTIYVGGLPYEVTDVEIEQYFSEYGQVERIDKLTFNDSGRFNGIAFVTFDSGRSAKKALAASGHAFYDDERYLVVRKYVSGGGNSNGAGKKNGGAQLPIERVKGYNRVYVGNLPWQCREEEVREWFSGVGCKIKFLRMGADKEGNFRGFAHLHFATDECMDKALQLNGEYWDGRQVKISPAVPPKR
ncbi:RNA-binding domain-containing protein [Chloropicon primus]|uniref:RNA-binding domain-containing protein n=1 Tax=Chloropicon primus TaxID=1764295 RepID=A0A5B8MTW9_9CHLO|nr:RNA-binding domain-containing protein [Chloropicon primus]UPR03164.1 RNA-binding domain-containing protein [Chloropicon primus]|eukprot:QDZ23953.1 RNA-binding domain-containing protein [Chloropicon primus]